jgi:4a-hydroxytetrahydrobiopterin dehydratase
MEKLTDAAVESFLNELSDWKLLEEKWIEKGYRFSTYLSGVDFVQRVAKLSEETNHHPFISIEYKLVRVKLSSWKARGLTNLDFQLASQYDSLYEEVKQCLT